MHIKGITFSLILLCLGAFYAIGVFAQGYCGHTLDGRWKDDLNGQEIEITVTPYVSSVEAVGKIEAKYAKPNKTCKNPDKQGRPVPFQMDFDGGYDGDKISASIYWCTYHIPGSGSSGDPMNNTPYSQGLGVGSLQLTQSEDGMKLSGSFTGVHGNETISFTRLSNPGNVTPTIKVKSVAVDISILPQMEAILGTAETTPFGAYITWTGQITYTARGESCSGGPQFDSPQLRGVGAAFGPLNFGGFYGGKLTLIATTPCGQGASATDTKTVGGINPTGAMIRQEIGSLGAPFDPDDLKRIACQESRQTQFIADHTPFLGGGGDAGIMQICYKRTAGDFWNWKTNIADGRANLMDKLAYAKKFTKVVQTRVVRGMGPFPDATPLTNDQIRLEAIKRYNAGYGNKTDKKTGEVVSIGTDVGYWEWNDAAKSWKPNPQGGGDPNYVANVLGKDPNCGKP